MKIATIDIGSNAARLLIVDVVVNKQGGAEFEKVDFVRLPLRLGFDVFESGKISQVKTEKLVAAMQVFQSLLRLALLVPCGMRRIVMRFSK